MMDWLDPSLANAEDPIKWNEHFWPKAEILNLCDGSNQTDPASESPRLKKDKNKSGHDVYRACSTIKHQCVMYTRCNYKDFPFDNQTFEISCKLSGIRIPEQNSSTRPEACNPTRWRNEDGHELIPEADCLPEFTLVRLVGKAYSSRFGPFPDNLKWDDPSAFRKYKKECDENNGNPAFIDQYTLQM